MPGQVGLGPYHGGKAPVYDLIELAAFDVLVEVYDYKLRETIGDGDIDNGHRGITHASTAGYHKLSGSLKPDTSVDVPIQFVGDGGLEGVVMTPEDAIAAKEKKQGDVLP